MPFNVDLVSFADGAYTNRKSGFHKEATEMELFRSIDIFDRHSLEPEYFQKHAQFMLSRKRGFGYWIWKSQVVRQKLATMNENDVLVYLDVGFELNPRGRYRLMEYIEMAQDSSYKSLGFSNTHTEYCRTKMDLAVRLGLDSKSMYMRTTQLTSGFFILVKNNNNSDLVKTWSELAVEQNYHFSDDTPSLTENHENYIEHRHDQSIFSLLRKIGGCEVTHYEVQNYPHFEQMKDTLPLHASRQGRDKSYQPELV